MFGASSKAKESLDALKEAFVAPRVWNVSAILDPRDPDLIAAEKELDEFLAGERK